MGFSAVPGVTAGTEYVSNGDLLASHDLDASMLQVAEGDDDAAGINHHVVPCKSGPPLRRTSVLSQCVAERGQPTVCGMIGLTIVDGSDHTGDRG